MEKWTPDEMRTMAFIVARIANEIGGDDQIELEKASEALYNAANQLEGL